MLSNGSASCIPSDQAELWLIAPAFFVLQACPPRTKAYRLSPLLGQPVCCRPINKSPMAGQAALPLTRLGFGTLCPLSVCCRHAHLGQRLNGSAYIWRRHSCHKPESVLLQACTNRCPVCRTPVLAACALAPGCRQVCIQDLARDPPYTPLALCCSPEAAPRLLTAVGPLLSHKAPNLPDAGIPKFYRWLSERYPLLNQPADSAQIPVIDNLYLDMNGITHNCTHGNDPDTKLTETEMVVRIFNYLDRLFQIVKPQKLLFMAVDGEFP